MSLPAWLLSDFESLHEALLAIAESNGVGSDTLDDLLSRHQDALKQLLDQRPRNDESRKRLQSGKVQLSDDEYEVNELFVQTTVELSDELSLDESLAAELLLLGQEESTSLDREPKQAAVIIFHRRRHYIAECIRLILSLSSDNDVDPELRAILKQSAMTIAGRGTKFGDRIIKTMATIREWIRQLADKHRLVGFHNIPSVAEIRDVIVLQANALSQQHQALALSLTSLIRLEQCGIPELDSIVAGLKSQKEYDVLLIHQIPPFLAIVSFVLSPSTKSTVTELKQKHAEFVRSSKDDRWDLQYVHAAVHLSWFTEMNGLARDAPPTLPIQINYQKDIHEPSKLVLSDGGLDFMMAIAADTNPATQAEASREEFRRFLQTKTPIQTSEMVGLLSDFRIALTAQLENFMDSFISNMADILKEIKNIEEEDHMIQRESAYNLERFFMFIGFLFRNRPDAGMTFWGDRESNLYGFLTWASQRQTPAMASAYCDMLSSLAFGPDSAQMADQFLTEDTTIQSHKAKRPQQVSWDFIFQSLQYYVTQLRPRIEPPPPAIGYRGMPPPVEPAELDEDSIRVIDSYLRLITQIITFNDSARDRIFENATAQLIPTLMEMLDSPLPGSLIASIFNTIAGFCLAKSENDNIQLWDAVDRWIMVPPPNAGPGMPALRTKPNGYMTFLKSEVVTTTFASALAFVKLMTALIRPTDPNLTDVLPFPENLGSTNRLPGIDFYVDSIVEMLIEADKQLSDNETLLLQTACLDFILTALLSFDDQLIVIANTSSIAVDSVMKTTDLATYVKLHPFSRLMDHLFSEGVLGTLFSIVRKGVDAVAAAEGTKEDSPLIQSILMAIQIMTIIMDKEHTFLEVVRPQLWKDDNAPRRSVANTALASFETAVLYHLSIIVHLGLLGGMEYSRLAVTSLKLLTTLAASTTVTSTPTSHFSRTSGKNRLLTITDSEGESRRIAFGFINALEKRIDPSTAVEGQLHPDIIVKLEILSFLNTCLASTPDKPTLAHLILGFSINDNRVDISEEPSGIGSGTSVFHSVLNIASSWEERDEQGTIFDGELMVLKRAALTVLHFLWKSKLTYSDTLYILRENKFFFAQFSQEAVINNSTMWDGFPFTAPDFFFNTSVDCCRAYIDSRTYILDYLALELRQMSLLGASSSLNAYYLCLMGVTDAFDVRLNHASLLDYLDFLEFDVEGAFAAPDLMHFGGLNFSPYLRSAAGQEVEQYNIDNVRSMLQLRKLELKKTGQFGGDAEELMDIETEQVAVYLQQDNNFRQFKVSRTLCLQHWCRLVIALLETSLSDPNTKSSYIMQALQTVIPKLEQHCGNDERITAELTVVAQSLISNLDFESINLGRERGADVAHDRLYQLFRLALRGAQSPIASSKIREDFYDILCRYLNGMAGLSSQLSILNRRSLQTIRGSGERFLEILCNDAYVGAGTCKLLALNLLDALVCLSQEEESTYIIDVLRRQNLIVVLVQSLKSLDQEALQVTDGGQSFMTLVKAITGLLLRLSRTKLGAGMVLSSGYFMILKECGLFTIDPDIGIAFMGGKNISSYYDLLLSFVRVLVSCLICKGLYNKSDLIQTQRFLADNRILVSSILKRNANIGGVLPNAGDMGPLVDMFVVLYSMVDAAAEA
ncbi:hypothetical protein AOL_s00215g175 [Orbilia oligospora ATCC 24927]|uniref:Nucleoporin n=1 Tax=Arthrobotrys oligospora (strain ATCC 24927 / CBS 115.81 / DSM 1491) TaxID=756982 RepID=G1XTP6_ARTOA|nr:hypothetical protein AOL_s00215g175 [Orbilia oligospora ATCC 24927]EGX43439.1 hypothetical protein AOL_s00215g175 [Orbilia oligospora ATCC 24927]